MSVAASREDDDRIRGSLFGLKWASLFLSFALSFVCIYLSRFGAFLVSQASSSGVGSTNNNSL